MKTDRILTLLFTLHVAISIAACTPVQPKSHEELTYPELEFQLPQVEQLVLNNGIQLYLK